MEAEIPQEVSNELSNPVQQHYEAKRLRETHEYSFFRPSMAPCAFDGIKKGTRYGFDNGYDANVETALKNQSTHPLKDNDEYQRDGARVRDEARIIHSREEWESLKNKFSAVPECDESYNPLEATFSLLDEPPASLRGARMDDRLDICFNNMDCRNPGSNVDDSEQLKYGVESRRFIKDLYDKNVKPKWSKKFEGELNLTD